MVLVAGATGFVGRFLVSRLVQSGTPVRVIARKPGHADAILGHNKEVEIVRGDLLEQGSIIRALAAEDTLVHLATALCSHSEERSPEEIDLRIMANLIRACDTPNPPRIILLSTLTDMKYSKSTYFAAKLEAEKMLVESGLPHVIFKCPPIVGRWGILFRLLEAAVHNQKIIWLPKSANTPCQPIHLGDVASYIVSVIENEHKGNKIYEIAGNDVLSYQDIVDLFVSTSGFTRAIIPLPFNPINSSAKFFSKYTGLPLRAIKIVLEETSVPMTLHDTSAYNDFPSIRPIGYMEAIIKSFKER